MSSLITQLAQALRGRKTSATELAQQAIAAAKNRADLNALITCDEAGALAAAERADAALATNPASPLAGIPFAHKDIFCTNGLRTTCASRMLDNFVPPYDATVVGKLASASAISIGKAN